MSVGRPESLGSSAMEEDEDDLYGEADSDFNQSAPAQSNAQEHTNNQEGSTPDEDEDSDSVGQWKSCSIGSGLP
jgi:hypothetical protein